MREVGEYIFFARFKEAAFGKVAASVIADTEVTVFSGDNPDGGVWFGRYAPGNYTAEEITGLEITVTNTPTSFDERRKGSKSKTLQSIKVDSVRGGCLGDVFPFTVVRTNQFLPFFEPFVNEEMRSSFG